MGSDGRSKVVTSTVTIQASARFTAIGDALRAYSLRHLTAAKYFAEQLTKHEAAYDGFGFGEHFETCTWYGTAAIILSFSAVEAAINEAEVELKLPDELIEALERSPAIKHAQAILAYQRCTSFDRGSTPMQRLQLLCDMRNRLVHPKAELDSQNLTRAKLSKKIVAARLPRSPFQRDPKLAFPDGCMSAGTAMWSWSTARTFIQDFRSQLALPKTA